MLAVAVSGAATSYITSACAVMCAPRLALARQLAGSLHPRALAMCHHSLPCPGVCKIPDNTIVRCETTGMIALIEKGTRRVYSMEAYAAYFSPRCVGAWAPKLLRALLFYSPERWE